MLCVLLSIVSCVVNCCVIELVFMAQYIITANFDPMYIDWQQKFYSGYQNLMQTYSNIRSFNNWDQKFQFVTLQKSCLHSH